MKKVTDSLPDISSLKRRFDVVLNGALSTFISATNDRREDVIINRRFFIMSFAFVLAVIFALAFAQARYSSLLNVVLICCVALWLMVLLVTGRKWFINERLLAKEINMALVPILSDVFDRQLVYSCDVSRCEETLRLLKDSELMTHADITIEVDDQYTIYGKHDISFRELVVSQHLINSEGATGQESKSDSHLFKGVFVIVALPEEHPAETYISTRNDQNGFAHQTFWSDILCFSEVKEVKLEWNEFNRDLYVASSNPTAARELLTPSFMGRLHDWWTEPGFGKHRNIRISFKGNKMYMLLPEETIKIASSTTSTKLLTIRKYAWSIVRPVWRTLSLVDDVL